MKINNILLYFAIAKHCIWGFIILSTPFSINTSTLAILNGFFGDFHIGGMLLILSSFSTLYGLLVERDPVRTVFFFLPLLFFIWLFGLTALNAVLQGHFPDGVIRPWQFILADQLNAILLMIFLTVVIFEPLWHKKSYE